ncbi:hypothetical protein [uncultured Cedecea sp.]|uniref:SpaN/EivJ family type III secretion system needle length determinant n=1 Tax=uncultured Cedecea sp. TaxID=988762 RepID=UPI002626C451|nr:hypothetical protein [uncultured Cedecea sp.]
MIEKKSEVISVLTSFNEKECEERDFLNSLYKKRKDQKNGHGEDINARIFNVIPELYHKYMFPDDRGKPSVTKHDWSGVQNIMHQMNQDRQQQIFFTTMSKINENDTNLKEGIASSNLRTTTAAEVAVVDNSEKLTDVAGDDSKELNIETMKTQVSTVPLKNDVLSSRQEPMRPRLETHRSQRLISDKTSKNNISMVTKSEEIQKKSFNLDYPFSRWPGERSVKVSIPVDINASRHLTLLPSDFHAAEMLLRQAGQLSGFTTELLHPQQEDEESEKKQTRDDREEE